MKMSTYFEYYQLDHQVSINSLKDITLQGFHAWCFLLLKIEQFSTENRNIIPQSFTEMTLSKFDENTSIPTSLTEQKLKPESVCYSLC